MPDEHTPIPTALLDQVVITSGDRHAMQKPASEVAAKRLTGSKGPAAETAGIKVEKGQER